MVTIAVYMSRNLAGRSDETKRYRIQEAISAMLVVSTAISKACVGEASRGDAGGIATGAGRRLKPLMTRPCGSTTNTMRAGS